LKILHFVFRHWAALLAALVFAAVFAAVYSATPLRPYATLQLPEMTHFLRFSPDGGTLLTVADVPPAGWYGKVKGPIRVWDVRTGVERLALAPGRTLNPDMICISPDSRLCTAGWIGQELDLWDLRTGETVAVPEKETFAYNIQFSPDGRFLIFQTVDADKDIAFWDVVAKQPRYRIKADTFGPLFATDGKSFVITNFDSSVLKDDHYPYIGFKRWRWDPSQGPVLDVDRPVACTALAFSPDLRTYATADGREIALWDTATGDKRFSTELEEPDAYCQCLRFLRGGQMLSVENNRSKTLVWDLASSPCYVGAFTGPGLYRFRDVSGFGAPSPDGKYVAVPFNDDDIPWEERPRPPHAGARIIRLPTLEEAGRLTMDDHRTPFEMHGLTTPTVTISPDGKWAAVGFLEEPPHEPYLSWLLPWRFNPFPASKGGEVVRVWDVASRTPLMTFHESSLQFSPDGKVLAVLHDDRLIDLWRLPFEKDLLAVFLWTTGIWLSLVAVPCLLVWGLRRWSRSAAAGRRPR